MSITEVIGVVFYLTALWAVCALAAAVAMWGTGLAYYGLLRALDWFRDGFAAGLERGLPHPTRKHGRPVTRRAPGREQAGRRAHPVA